MPNRESYKVPIDDVDMAKETAITFLYGMRAENLNLDDSYIKDRFDALTLAIRSLEQGTVTDFADKCRECGARYGKMLKARAEEKDAISRTGRWIDNNNGAILCNYCHTWFNKDNRYSYMHYCPNCGAKMAKGRNEE